ncbi:lysozyme [Pelagibacter phage HTVC105P]|nr:lysozyme [Pelagibacter phage HTVC105P]
MNNNYRKRTDFIVIHSTKTKPSENLGVKEITKKQRKEGFFHCAYHFIIKRDGTIEEGRDIEMSGAILPINQPLITNQNSIAIALVGGLSQDGANLDTNFTFKQFVSLRDLVKKLKKKYSVEVVGCRNAINSNSCMSFDVQAIVD